MDKNKVKRIVKGLQNMNEHILARLDEDINALRKVHKELEEEVLQDGSER